MYASRRKYGTLKAIRTVRDYNTLYPYRHRQTCMFTNSREITVKPFQGI